MGLKSWLRKQSTAGAVAARERGDSVYMLTLPNQSAATVQTRVNAIERVGWRLENQQQVKRPGASKQLAWALTFRRAE